MKLTVCFLFCLVIYRMSHVETEMFFQQETVGWNGIGDVIQALLEATTEGRCSILLLTESASLIVASLLAQKLSGMLVVDSMGLFELPNTPGNNRSTQNITLSLLTRARNIRLVSRCVTVIVISEDSDFLYNFAKDSKNGRLLSETTRLLVVTSLRDPSVLHRLLSRLWTYSMMGTMFLNLQQTPISAFRWNIYSHLPYTASGPQNVQIGMWSTKRGLIISQKTQPFPNKFANFYMANVNVTSLPFLPFWNEESVTLHNGTVTKVYTGTDYRLLVAIANSLNFTINVLPSASWNEVDGQVEKGLSMMATVYHIVLPDRAKRYDFTFTYENAYFSFATAKPSLKPKWQALYYPFTDDVWIVLLLAFPFFTVILAVVIRLTYKWELDVNVRSGRLGQELVGEFLGQDINWKFYGSASRRFLVGTWLFYAFIVGAAYKGNLTAFLTLPKYPPRPEALEQLLDYVGSITMGSYGKAFQDFFRASDSKDFQELANRIVIGPSVASGLQQAVDKKQAHVAGKRVLQMTIAKHFTDVAGWTKLYLGRQSIFPGPSAWPIPHDAPYKPALDRLMMAVIEAGLYEKWSAEIIDDARQKSKLEQMASPNSLESQVIQKEADSANQQQGLITALTIVHMQGPLFLIILGLILSMIIFLIELTVFAIHNSVKKE